MYLNLYMPSIAAIKPVYKGYSTSKITGGDCTKGNENPFGSKIGLAMETYN